MTSIKAVRLEVPDPAAADAFYTQTLGLDRFVRSRESEADHIGLVYMARGGYDPHQAVAFWKRIETRVKGFEGCHLHRVRVYESRSNFVDYRGPTS